MLKERFCSLPIEKKSKIHQMVELTYHSCWHECNGLSKSEVFNLIVGHIYKKERDKHGMEGRKGSKDFSGY
ncbi:hypothetical protein [Flagellimonas aequoris]|uniref:Uncharacterized protein n=1 Tax=Flagellimonas aequoris TaxID=2306997 RepID=A0A418N6V7_9FLAO|nr:hypothetical protein [Allomuricauda aequoris]RIV70162.1 hypothetical protein D2U88_11165 [Allomuricauda aequoris]TXK01759.1 hypothetical protein FQ019_11070 [Allomuricauda aequoris]